MTQKWVMTEIEVVLNLTEIISKSEQVYPCNLIYSWLKLQF